MKRYWWRVSSMTLIVTLLVSLMSFQKAGALSTVGPDPAEYGGANVMYTLSDTNDVRGATTMGVPIYYKSKPGNVAVNVSYGQGGANVQFFNGAGWSGNNPGSVVIPAGVFAYDPLSGYWTTTLSARLNSANNFRDFRINIPGPGIVGYSSSNTTDRFAIANENRCDQFGTRVGCGQFFNYALPFAPACNVAGGVANFTIFDADNNGTGANFNVQPRQRFTVQLRDLTTGFVQTFDNVTNMGNNQTATFFFAFAQAHKYQLLLDGVYANNVIQFHLPFDSIFSTIPCSYNLTPSASGAPATAAPGAQVIYNYSVNNNGAIASNNPTFWAVKQIVYPPAFAGTVPGQVDFASCANYPGNSSCADLQGGTVGGFSPGTTNVAVNATASTLNIPANAPLGTRYCRLLAVDPAAVDNNGAITVRNRWSIPSCVTVSQYPMTYFGGGDLWAGGNYSTGAGACMTSAQIYTASNTVSASTVLSSNEQFAALATSTIRGFGSAGRSWQGAASAPGTAENVLFFANTPVSGNSGMNHCLTNYYQSTGSTLPSTDISTFPDGTYFVPGNVTLTASGVVSGNIKIVSGGNVTLASNIRYNTAPVGTIGLLPHLIVVARQNITVANGVAQLDGIYQAGSPGVAGVFYTCATALTPTGNNLTCPVQLRVNGAVIASRIALRRTGGAVANPSRDARAAEYFTMTPDNILGAYGRSVSSSQIQTMVQTELPPRY